ncbi:hypothetical protein VNO78_22503 [Psophocarpus tetragonolobus]|uniref:Uncharacterized protein n=1 Tax=Psophocarpus tetragonolobus TaxID=3891 RepID=A0AAN9S1Z5_PSOTE
MKKLYRKGTVHPSPSTPTISEQLSFLPAAILTLTLSLSPQDREVLAYLISCSNASANPPRNPKTLLLHPDHPPLFHCSCFRCYMSYWVRWNSSPNHQLIHQIIDAFEDSFPHTSSSNPMVKRNKRPSKTLSPSHFPSLSLPQTTTPLPDTQLSPIADHVYDKASVRKFVSFIGERIWGAWGH